MRRPGVFALVLFLVAAGAAIGAPPAAACSCLPIPDERLSEFEGRVVDKGGGATTTGDLVRFGAVVPIQGAVSDPVEVEVTSGDGGSCGFPSAPVVGATYRVRAYEGRSRDGAPRLFANICGGALVQTAASAVNTDPAPAWTADATPSEPSQRTLLGVVAIVITVGGLLALRTRRPN